MGDKNYYCKIDGTVYNLKKIQDIIDENPEIGRASCRERV